MSDPSYTLPPGEKPALNLMCQPGVDPGEKPTISRRDLEFNAHLGGMDERAKAEAKAAPGDGEQALLRAALAGPLVLSDGTEIRALDGAFLILLGEMTEKAASPNWKWLRSGGFDEASLCWLILNPSAAYKLLSEDDGKAAKNAIFEFSLTKSMTDLRQVNQWVNVRLESLRSKGADVPKSEAAPRLNASSAGQTAAAAPGC